jgi:hypothetical protein
VTKATDELTKALSNQIEGIPVEVIETGEILAF